MIPKSEATQLIERAHAAELEKLEQQIDAAILQSGGGGILINACGWGEYASQTLRKKYEDGGWLVDISDNQRDGHWFKLT